jgi:hypothetical protein
VWVSVFMINSTVLMATKPKGGTIGYHMRTSRNNLEPPTFTHGIANGEVACVCARLLHQQLRTTDLSHLSSITMNIASLRLHTNERISLDGKFRIRGSEPTCHSMRPKINKLYIPPELMNSLHASCSVDWHLNFTASNNERKATDEYL